jgi:hypothetical protein
MMQGIRGWIIQPLLSSINLSTRRRTRKVRPQKGNISTSNTSPRFLDSSFSVCMISIFERTRTHSPG